MFTKMFINMLKVSNVLYHICCVVKTMKSNVQAMAFQSTFILFYLIVW